MRKTLLKYASMIAALALVITTVSANSACFMTMYQEKLPETAILITVTRTQSVKA